MFQELIDDYRPYIADALELEYGRWRDQDGNQSLAVIAARKRGLAAMLFELADAYEEQDR